MDVTEEKLSLGRAQGNELRFPDDASLSRRHLLLEREGEDWFLTDLGSKNGTRINGVLVQNRHPIRPGDRVTAGRVVLMLKGEQPGSGRQVAFHPGSEADAPRGATIMTSLEGLLSSSESVVTTSEEAKAPVPQFGPEALSALIRAGRELVGHRPLVQLFELILELSVQAVGAERGAIVTVEGEDLATRAYHGEGLSISTFVRDRVLQDKASVLVRDVMKDDAFKERQSVFGQNIRSMMAVPLQTDSEVLGIVYVDSLSFIKEFKPEDLNLLTVLANVAAIRVEQEKQREREKHARVLQRDLEQAADIQARLLPDEPPIVPGCDLAGHNVPSRTVGGDYYDFIPYDDETIGLVLGDVSGKGLPASLMMTGLQARVRMLTEVPGDDLADIMSRLDRQVANNCPRNRFISLVLCLLDAKTGEMAYCNAGHNPPVRIRHDGEVSLLETGGTVLGILPELGYTASHVRLEPGDLLLLYSDGVTEAVSPDGEEYGQDRLVRTALEFAGQSARAVVEEINKSVESFTDGAPPIDDMTMLVVRRTS
jgi:serine phosphatase RsbU (regulator of sigma subunit)/pSer/pThr/pTyr-binding forkhead associated (FHA) protein